MPRLNGSTYEDAPMAEWGLPAYLTYLHPLLWYKYHDHRASEAEEVLQTPHLVPASALSRVDLCY